MIAGRNFTKFKETDHNLGRLRIRHCFLVKRKGFHGAIQNFMGR